jgi:hypothetical protein
MRQKLGDGTYPNIDALRADLDTLVRGWASYSEAGGVAGEQLASAARALELLILKELRP